MNPFGHMVSDISSTVIICRRLCFSASVLEVVCVLLLLNTIEKEALGRRLPNLLFLDAAASAREIIRYAS